MALPKMRKIYEDIVLIKYKVCAADVKIFNLYLYLSVLNVSDLNMRNPHRN